ncbi:hypothetical protein [Streptomyces sp. NPDC018000]|uniref:hypothetical protein n=1 Tax=Streptomyces sp. NPDC018000 TaxID=3365028 RepID=UPI00379FCCE1
MALTPRNTPPFHPPRTTRPTPSATKANEAIRALVDARAGQDWSSAESAAYEVLLIEWAAATRGVSGDIIEAA